MNFYDNFSLLCQKKGVSMSKALADLGISNTMITKYKAGSKPRNNTISDMCVYFGCELGELLGSPYTPDMPEYVPPMPRSAVDSYQTFLRTASILEENEIKRVTQFMYQVLGERKD